MSLDLELGVKDFDKAIPLWNSTRSVEPLAERAERVDACRCAILSIKKAKVGIGFFVGVIVGDMGGVILSELTTPQKIHSLAPIWFALAAFFAAVSLSFYSVCVVHGCCSKDS